ncbi:hypothetical protein PR048_001826 [Dryococelus australis]|uniref:Uncharacterized protein n=1 Tax=Dryococelus australis TaxID=614101 RepID=A0ABQ9IJ50_9NEOP|nr:hypothetical protein PR048_001826 [Dryococelus australis]
MDAVAKRKGLYLHSVVFISVGQMERNTRSIYFNILDTVMHEFDRRFLEDQGDIMEATNALKKTDILSSMAKLSSLMILAVEQEEVKKIPLDVLVNDSAIIKERRYPLMH